MFNDQDKLIEKRRKHQQEQQKLEEERQQGELRTQEQMVDNLSNEAEGREELRSAEEQRKKDEERKLEEHRLPESYQQDEQMRHEENQQRRPTLQEELERQRKARVDHRLSQLRKQLDGKLLVRHRAAEKYIKLRDSKGSNDPETLKAQDEYYESKAETAAMSKVYEEYAEKRLHLSGPMLRRYQESLEKQHAQEKQNQQRLQQEFLDQQKETQRQRDAQQAPLERYVSEDSREREFVHTRNLEIHLEKLQIAKFEDVFRVGDEEEERERLEEDFKRQQEHLMEQQNLQREMMTQHFLSEDDESAEQHSGTSSSSEFPADSFLYFLALSRVRRREPVSCNENCWGDDVPGELGGAFACDPSLPPLWTESCGGGGGGGPDPNFR